MSSTPRSIVMGFVSGLPSAEVTPFLHSLRTTGYRGRICLFVARTDDRAVAEFTSLADVVRLDPLYTAGVHPRTIKLLRWAKNTKRIRRAYPALFCAAVRERQRDLEYQLEGLQSLRYRHYLDYLTGVGADADYVMVSDVRDVLFQRDPFAGVVDDLEVFLEADHVTLRSEPFNRRWIRQLYGRRTLSKLAGFTASCSGVTLGTRAGMCRYLRIMVSELARHRRPLGSHDQGAHNYLLRTNRFAPVQIKSNELSRVITLGLQRRVSVNTDGLIINRDGTLPAVVHQYDRYPDLAARLRGAVVKE